MKSLVETLDLDHLNVAFMVMSLFLSPTLFLICNKITSFHSFMSLVSNMFASPMTVRRAKPVSDLGSGKILSKKRIRDYKFKRVKTYWTVVCLIGLVVHNSLTFNDYFKYFVTSEVRIEMEDEFIPPALSFCLYTVSLRIPGNFPARSPCRSNSTAYDFNMAICGSQLSFKFSLSELYYHLSIDLFDRIYPIQVKNIQGRLRPIGNYGNRSFAFKYFKKFYSSNRQCLRYRVFEDPSQALSLRKISHLTSMERYYASISFNMSGLYDDEPQISIYIHESSTFPRGYEIYSLRTKIMKENPTDRKKILHYKKFITKYLHAPYFSKCVDYNSKKLESRDHCIDVCTLELLMRNHPKHTFSHLLLTEIQFNDSRRFLNNHSLMYEYNDMCRIQCPLNCQTIMYQPIMASELRSSGFGNLFSLTLEHMEATTSIRFSGKVSLLELIIYIASITSLWIGFSVMNSIHVLIHKK